MITKEDVRKMAKAVGVSSFSHRRLISKETLISDLKHRASQFGRSDVVQRCNLLLRGK